MTNSNRKVSLLYQCINNLKIIPQCGIINLFYQKHKIFIRIERKVRKLQGSLIPVFSCHRDKASSTFANSGTNIMGEERNPWLDIALGF